MHKFSGSDGNSVDQWAETERRGLPSPAWIYVLESAADAGATHTRLSEVCHANVVSFADESEYFKHERPNAPSCLLLDFEPARDLKPRARDALLRHWGCPVIHMSKDREGSDVLAAFRGGAVDFLQKPLDSESLLAAIRLALHQDLTRRAHGAASDELSRRLSRLTPRERQVLTLVAGGMRNKQSAATLGISEVTLQAHRGQIMHKMVARSFAHLIRMSVALNIAPNPLAHGESWISRGS